MSWGMRDALLVDAHYFVVVCNWKNQYVKVCQLQRMTCESLPPFNHLTHQNLTGMTMLGGSSGGTKKPLLTSRPLVKMRVVQAQFRLAAWRFCREKQTTEIISLDHWRSSYPKYYQKNKKHLYFPKKTAMAIIGASFFSFASCRRVLTKTSNNCHL